MRNILAVIGLLVIGFAGLGWYMGWYKLSVSRSTDGNLQITTNVDTQKVGNDSSEFFKNAATVVGSQVDKAAQEAKTSAPPSTPGATPGPVVPPSGTPIVPPPVPFGSVGADGMPIPPVPPASVAPPAPVPPPRMPIQLVPPK
jgi:hypothetical protein